MECEDPLRKEVAWREAENAAAAAKAQHLQDERAEKKRLFAKCAPFPPFFTPAPFLQHFTDASATDDTC